MLRNNIDLFFNVQKGDLLLNNEFLDWVYYYYTYVGSIFVSILCIKLYWSRSREVSAARTWVPLQTILFWTFFFIPFGSLIPSFFIWESGNLEEVARFQRIMISMISFIILLLMALFSIYFNLRLLKND